MTAMLDLPKFEVPRDRWNRPLLNGRTYTRVSTLAKALDDQRALLDWNARQAVIGISRSPDLIALASTTDPDDKTKLNSVVERAKERAKSKAGADIGTATHSATEYLDRGESLDGLPEPVVRDAMAYRATLQRYGLVPLAAETFVVCDEVNAAGTFDRLLRGPSRVVIGDLKTSANPDSAKWAGLAWAIQLATYAHAKPWLPDRGIVEWSDLGLPEPDRERGLIIHIVQGTGEVRLYSVDLAIGWGAAQIADSVLGARKMKPTLELP